MPAAYAIDSSRAVIFSRAWGVHTDEDLREHYQALREDPAFDPSFRQLIDLREVEKYEVSAATLRDLAHLRIFRQGTRRAIVVGNDVMFGMARMFVSYSGTAQGGDVAIFRDPVEARRWLGVERDVTDQTSEAE